LASALVILDTIAYWWEARCNVILEVSVRRFGASGIAPEEQKVEGREPSRTPDLPDVERQRGN
jgi:hypothetical protein